MNERLIRSELLLGKEGIKKLQDSFVVIVGLGAVGSYVVEALARSGVGRIRIVDFDKICPTNINRQLFALSSTIGRLKIEVAEERILEINPKCEVEAINCFVHNDKMDMVLEGSPDMVVDAIDALNPKIELLIAAQKRELPVISSMGAALRTDPSHIKVAKLKRVHNCPLARQVRKRLRRRGSHLEITCVYSNEKPIIQAIRKVDPKINKKKMRKEIEKVDPDINQNEGEDFGRTRNTLCSLPTITGIFGLMIANEVLRQLTDDFCKRQ